MERKKIKLPPGYGKVKKKREKKIEFSSVLEDTVFNYVSVHNSRHPNKKVALDDARRVVKRSIDLGANSDVALVRLRNFLSKKAGDSLVRYTDDDDLLTKH